MLLSIEGKGGGAKTGVMVGNSYVIEVLKSPAAAPVAVVGKLGVGLQLCLQCGCCSHTLSFKITDPLMVPVRVVVCGKEETMFTHNTGMFMGPSLQGR